MIDYRLRLDACASDANEDVIAEYAPWGLLLTDDMDEELLVRIDWRLRTTQESHRPPWSLHRPRQPRS